MSPFLHASANEVARYFQDCPVVELEGNEVVCDVASSRTHVHIVTSGTVRASILSAKGTAHLIFYAPAAGLFGDTMCFGATVGIPSAINVVAVDRCRVIRVRHADFRRTCEQNPALFTIVLKIAHEKLACAVEQLERATFKDTTGQLAGLLQAFSHHKKESQDGSSIAITHEDLANATGRTRVSVTNSLNRLKRAGAIRLSRGHVVVTDEGILDDFAAR